MTQTASPPGSEPRPADLRLRCHGWHTHSLSGCAGGMHQVDQVRRLVEQKWSGAVLLAGRTPLRPQIGIEIPATDPESCLSIHKKPSCHRGMMSPIGKKGTFHGGDIGVCGDGYVSQVSVHLVSNSPSRTMEGWVPTARLSMRRIRRVLELHFGARTSARVIALEVGVGRSTVQDYVARAMGAGLGWPLSADLSDVELGQGLRRPFRQARVHIAQYYILGRLRNVTFFSPAEWRLARVGIAG